MLKHFIVSLSFANIVFLPVWIYLLNIDQYYYMKNIPEDSSFIAVLLNVVILALIIFSLLYLAQKFHSFMMDIVLVLSFLTLLILPVLVRFIDPVVNEFIGHFFYLLKVVLGLAIIFVVYYNKKALILFTRIFLITSPFVLVTFAQAGWSIFHDHKPVAVERTKSVSSVTAMSHNNRVIWLIFDELDERVAISERPDGLVLPVLDSIRQEAVDATQAYPPASATLRSIPALITGRLVVDAVNTDKDRLMLILDEDGDKQVDWRIQPNIFSNVKNMGLKTAVLGWYHPYSNIFGDTVDYCNWEEIYESPRIQATIGENMIEQLRMFDYRSHARLHRETYDNIRMRSSEILSNTAYDLVFIHFSIPHGPYSQRLTIIPDEADGYLANLALVDKTLSEVRAILELNGAWDETTIIISSDHYWRGSKQLDNKIDHRVPFVVKMAGQKQGMTYELPFNTVLTQNLILAILEGTVVSHADVVIWLNKNRTFGESPYQ